MCLPESEDYLDSSRSGASPSGANYRRTPLLALCCGLSIEPQLLRHTANTLAGAYPWGRMQDCHRVSVAASTPPHFPCLRAAAKKGFLTVEEINLSRIDLLG